MKILAIDTSATVCSVALLIDDKVICVDKNLPLQQAQIILPEIQNILQSNSININQLNALAFGCGPGSFTGVRIATSVIQGLGYALNLPIIPISSLAGLAQAAYDALKWPKLLVGVDARMQEIYWGVYQVNTNNLVKLIGEESVVKPSELIINQDILREDWSGVGDAWSVYQDQLPCIPQRVDITRLPSASGVLKLARAKFEQNEWVTAAEALPVYLRNNVAQIKK